MLAVKSIFLLTLICHASADCFSKQDCHECIQEPGCNWCSEPISNNSVKCINQTEITNKWCSTKNLIDQKPNLTMLSDEPLIDMRQIRPQKLSIKLRKNQEYQFNFTYRQAENYPIDLYYIIDVSHSIKKQKNTLASLGEKLSKSLSNLTNNFQLGLGSFVDKCELPFALEKASYKEKARPYAFKNHLSLSKDWQEFTSKIKKLKISENIDAPEGGFDALMQAMICNDTIKWREQARRLIVFSTDAASHMAGDGKLAGIVEPNDGKCHLKNGKYEGNVHDYPSISHINYVAKTKSFYIIFAINAEESSPVYNHYKSIAQLIDNSNLATLDLESGNVVNLITKSYKQIVDSVIMKANLPQGIKMKFSSNCSHPIENGCKNVHVGEALEFNVTIKATECFQGNQSIIIRPQGLTESIKVDVEVQCHCNCEVKLKHNICGKHGNLECGICKCDSEYFGQNCECHRNNMDSYKNDSYKNELCQAPSGIICSGLGVCLCGKCVCNKRNNPEEVIYGKFCEFNNYNCERHKSKLCAGNGKCNLGKCECDDGWSGRKCECGKSNTTCIQPGTNEVCSGHGTCSCGECICQQDRNEYFGNYCEECLTCSLKRCDELKDCVECQAYNIGKYDKTKCALKCTKFQTKIASDLGDKSNCVVEDEQGCQIVFKYGYENKQLVVKALKKKQCNISLWAIIGGVIGTILLAGLITIIIWKIFTTIHDKREYEKFEIDRKKSIWQQDGNPLYDNPLHTFSNPSYGKRSMRLSS